MDEPYKIILVDDEDEVRGRISSKISAESGFTIVGTAGNGFDALELIEKLSPSVVLTDIRMPFIDGIELASLIRRDFPTVRVAFITGYDEFEYAREAIELQVTSYLTKPVTQDDISHFLTRLKGELDREFKEKFNREQLLQSYNDNLSHLIDNCFTSFLVSSGTGQKRAMANLQACKVELGDQPYLLVQIQIERDGPLEDLLSHEREKSGLRSLLESILERHKFTFHIFRFSEGIFLLIHKRNDLFLKEIDPVLYEMVKMSEKFLSLSISLGVSQIHLHFRQLHQAYEESCKALEHSQFLRKGRIVYIDQLEDSEEKPQILSLTEGEISSLEQAVRYGSDSEMREIVDSLKMTALRNSQGRVNFRLYTVNLVNVLIKYAAFVGVDLDRVAGEDVLEKMIRFRSLEQVFDWVLTLTFKLREWNLNTRLTGSQKRLRDAEQIIENRFADSQLSLDSVCDEMGISVSYLSLLFRKNRNTTFIKYLTKVRMDKACELLRLTGDKIVDIAGQCGFNDVYYFSHSFKKSLGNPPKKYREETLS